MKEKFIEWCISRQGIISIVSVVIITLMLLILTSTGLASWTEIGWIAWKIIETLGSIFVGIFYFLAFCIFIPVWIIMGIVKLFKLIFKKNRPKVA